MADFVMPVLGADMQAGELVAWLKQPGDRVEKGDVIAEVDTEKAVVEVETLVGGVIEKLLVQPGERVPVGTVLATIRTAGEEEAPPPPQQAPAPRVAQPAAQRPPRRERPSPEPRGGGRQRVSPAARKLADEQGVDLASLVGSGPGGRIMLRDIEAADAAAARPAAAAADEEKRLRMRQSIAAAMSRSHREIPHFHVESVIDMTRSLTWLSDQNARLPVAQRLIYGVLLVKAAALALRKVPELNAIWADDRIQLREAIHVGVAIALPGGGLVAPAIHDTDKLTLGELMSQFRDLVQRARAGRLRSSEMSDPTITVTSLGELGAESVFGLIYPPQVGLIGFGRVTERAWSVEGMIGSRRVVHASLAGDHRVVDGYRASVYLAEVERLLQEPESL
jgi:pyruvate dehydrogenase E2 component (dihydrolipoamide acetyltransferase)